MTNKTNGVRELNPWVYDLSPLTVKDIKIRQWTGKGLIKADSKRNKTPGKKLNIEEGIGSLSMSDY